MLLYRLQQTHLPFWKCCSPRGLPKRFVKIAKIAKFIIAKISGERGREVLSVGGTVWKSFDFDGQASGLPPNGSNGSGPIAIGAPHVCTNRN